ncbi:MAG: hypothetical protein AMXMBFR66_23080 [Pseudomonadota bacterium]
MHFQTGIASLPAHSFIGCALCPQQPAPPESPMDRRRVVLAPAAAWCAAALPLRARAQDGTELVIGSMLDLSGPAASAMGQIRYAMQLRADELNAAGGVNGRKIRLVFEDNAGQPQQAVRVVQKMLRQDKVFAFVNNFGSGTNAATVKMIADAGTLNFAPWAASGVLRKISGESPLLYTTVPDYDHTTTYGLSWAIQNWKPKKIGLINMEGPLGDLMKAGVDAALKKTGMTLAASSSYKPGEIDFSSHVARMKAAGVDLIFGGTIVRENVGIMAEVKKLGWNDVKVLVGTPGRGGMVPRLGKEQVEGLYGIGQWNLLDLDSTDAAHRKFIDGFRKVAGGAVEPDENGAMAYFFTHWFLQIAQAGGAKLDNAAFAKAASATPGEGFAPYATLRFKSHHIEPELVKISEIKGGRWVDVTPKAFGA